MDSISPDANCIAGNHSDSSSGVRTFFGKLMDRFPLGSPALVDAYRRSDRTSSRPELAP